LTLTQKSKAEKFKEFKAKAIAKAKRDHLRAEFPDGTMVDFRRPELMKKT